MKSFLSDRARVGTPNQAAAPVPAPAVFSAASGKHVHRTQPEAADGTRIECVREGDRITRVIVHCSCGERIEIDCLYPAGK
ncbi:MAG: hypothetical protein NTU80_09950 [Verrucomicrobia bacterium]|nr:hypothetical protein [Verrucomicrobiota bacterium]